MPTTKRQIKYWKNIKDLNSSGNGWYKSVIQHTIKDIIPFKVRQELKKYRTSGIQIQKINASVTRRLMIHFNRNEYFSINRKVKDFSLVVHHFGFILMGVLFTTHPNVHCLTFQEPIILNGVKRQRLSFKFPRTVIKVHSFFNHPILTNLQLVYFFDTMKKALADTGYDLLIVDAPVDSNLDKIMRCTPSFLFLRTTKDRRCFMFLDGQQVSRSTIGKTAKARTFEEIFRRLGARLQYNRESIVCNRYVTSLSTETFLPKSNVKNLIVKEEYVNPDHIILPEQPKSRVLYLKPKKEEKKTNYGW